MSVSLADAEAILAEYVQAERDALDGKLTEWNGRRYEANDLGEIRAGRREWERKVSQLKKIKAGSNASNSFAATARFDQ